jgi:hypothetical protein
MMDKARHAAISAAWAEMEALGTIPSERDEQDARRIADRLCETFGASKGLDLLDSPEGEALFRDFRAIQLERAASKNKLDKSGSNP